MEGIKQGKMGRILEKRWRVIRREGVGMKIGRWEGGGLGLEKYI